MSERQQRMIAAFAAYERQLRDRVGDEHSPHNVIGTPIGTRLQRIIRLRDGWRLWTATANLIHGTCIELHNDGTVTRLTTRVDEGDEEFVVRPADDQARRQ